MRFVDKTVLVTGASRGIGRAVAEAFGREGARVFITGGNDASAVDDALERLRSFGIETDGGLFDVGSHEATVACMEQVRERFGGLDILVNNAGNYRLGPLLDTTREAWEDIIRVHLHGTFSCTVEAVRRFMRDKNRGKVINVTSPSIMGSLGMGGAAAYAAAKTAIASFTRTAARELLPLNIQVNAVMPVAASRMTETLADYMESNIGPVPAAQIRALPSPDRVVPAFMFLASPEADYITGHILAADGGYTA